MSLIHAHRLHLSPQETWTFVVFSTIPSIFIFIRHLSMKHVLDAYWFLDAPYLVQFRLLVKKMNPIDEHLRCGLLYPKWHSTDCASHPTPEYVRKQDWFILILLFSMQHLRVGMRYVRITVLELSFCMRVCVRVHACMHYATSFHRVRSGFFTEELF